MGGDISYILAVANIQERNLNAQVLTLKLMWVQCIKIEIKPKLMREIRWHSLKRRDWIAYIWVCVKVSERFKIQLVHFWQHLRTWTWVTMYKYIFYLVINNNKNQMMIKVVHVFKYTTNFGHVLIVLYCDSYP